MAWRADLFPTRTLSDEIEPRPTWCQGDQPALLKLDTGGPVRCWKCGQPPRRTAVWAAQARELWPDPTPGGLSLAPPGLATFPRPRLLCWAGRERIARAANDW